MQSKSPDSFSAERIDSEIFGSLITNIHERATKDLSEFLLDEAYIPE